MMQMETVNKLGMKCANIALDIAKTDHKVNKHSVFAYISGYLEWFIHYFVPTLVKRGNG